MFCHKTTTANCASVLIPSIWFVHVSFCIFSHPLFCDWHHTPLTILRKLRIMQTSMGVDVRNNIGICCYNPCCGGRKRMFETARALSLHLAQSPACKQRDRNRNKSKNHYLMQRSLFRAANSQRRFVETWLTTKHISFNMTMNTRCSRIGPTSIFPTCMATK
jgi:hypothetical protein